MGNYPRVVASVWLDIDRSYGALRRRHGYNYSTLNRDAEMESKQAPAVGGGSGVASAVFA
jgi:hypothetical protein